MIQSLAFSRPVVVRSSSPDALSGSTTRTQWRTAVPANHATAHTPAMPNTDQAPSARSRTGVRIKKPEPKIEARGVTTAKRTCRTLRGLISAMSDILPHADPAVR